jgi:hypothetical protein
MAAPAPTSLTQERRQNSQLLAQARKITRANTAIATLRRSATTLGTDLATAKTDIGGLKTLAGGLPSVLSQLADGLTKAGAGLTALQAGLTTIQGALQDPTTGLVGLNNARPQFGAFSATGVIVGGTGQTPPAKGPSANATKGPSGGAGTDFDGLYVVDFGNDVSKRVYTVNVFPYGPLGGGGAGAAPTGSATNCAASPTASALCGAAASAGPDTSPNHVLVQIGDGSSNGAANGFSLMATSG